MARNRSQEELLAEMEAEIERSFDEISDEELEAEFYDENEPDGYTLEMMYENHTDLGDF